MSEKAENAQRKTLTFRKSGELLNRTTLKIAGKAERNEGWIRSFRLYESTKCCSS